MQYDDAARRDPFAPLLDDPLAAMLRGHDRDAVNLATRPDQPAPEAAVVEQAVA